MNQAMDAVRYAEPRAFQNSAKLASSAAKRAFLRHLADLASWTCELDAHLQGRQKPTCDHARCEWTCYQSERETEAELSMSNSAVKRTRRALVLDGWIIVTQQSIGRGMKSRYTLNREKLSAYCRPGKVRKGVNVHPFPVTRKGVNVPPIPVPVEDKGVQCAPERGAMCPEKGGNVPLLYKKNPLEPLKNPEAEAVASLVSVEARKQTKRGRRIFTEDDALLIFDVWPNRGSKQEGLQAIKGALSERDASGSENPVAELLVRTKTWLAWHAREKAKGGFTPEIGYAQGWLGKGGGVT